MKNKLFVIILSVALLFIPGCSESDIPNPTDVPISKEPAGTANPWEVRTYENFTYYIQDGTVVIKGYNGDPESLVIPDYIDGIAVTKIDQMAFYQKLRLQSITLPETLEVLGGSAFYRCYRLASIYIPAKVKTIETNPFFRCSSLQVISVSEGNTQYTSIEGALYSKDGKVLWVYPEGRTEEVFYIPDSVETINSSAFGYHPIGKNIAIPASVTNFPSNSLSVFPDDLQLIVPSGSAAEAYAIRTGMNYRLKED